MPTYTWSYIVNHLQPIPKYYYLRAGDIAEAAVRQGVSRSSITIGASGGWNTTTARRYYFLNRTENLELTDSEIRGGLDGIILSELATSYVDRFPEFKLSQYIDMYYSVVSLYFLIYNLVKYDKFRKRPVDHS